MLFHASCVFSDAGGMEGKDAATSDTPELMDMMQFTELYECLWELPEMENYFIAADHMLNLPASGPNPLDFELLRNTQDAVLSLRRRCGDGISGVSERSFDRIKLVCFTEKGQDEKDHWKICLTDEAVMSAITWFNEVLGHPGKDRLLDAMH